MMQITGWLFVGAAVLSVALIALSVLFMQHSHVISLPQPHLFITGLASLAIAIVAGLAWVIMKWLA